jgi:hypothetical protein
MLIEVSAESLRPIAHGMAIKAIKGLVFRRYASHICTAQMVFAVTLKAVAEKDGFRSVA